MNSKKVQAVIDKINENQKLIEGFGAWDAGIRKKINYKIRLDWNYYSNRMEGGTLTQDETRSVMVGNIDVKGKPIKDVIEMKGHDDVVLDLLKIGQSEKRLSEKRIRDVHRLIMYEESPTEKEKIGVWKTQANMIYNYKDEKIEFAEPVEVPEKIHGLLNKINAYLDKYNADKNVEHPLIPIASFHLEYLTIHPFYDGNGRTARILTNLLFISCGLPAMLIKEKEKERYYKILGDIQVYGGDEALLVEFLGDRIIETQELILKALKGESIDESDDLDKRIKLLERELDAIDPNDEIKEQLSADYYKKVFKGWLGELIEESVPIIQKFNRLFTETVHSISLFNGQLHAQFVNEQLDEIESKLENSLEKASSNSWDLNESSCSISTHYGTLIKGGLKTFGCNYRIVIQFDTIKYCVLVDEFTDDNKRAQQKIIEDRLLHKPLSPSEIKHIVKKLSDSIYQHIDYRTKKAGLRL